MNERWYVARTHSNREREAEWHLRNQKFPIFMPIVNRKTKRRTSLVEAQYPVFPGYIFVRFDRSAPGWQRVNGTRGVQRLLPMHREVPTALPEGIVEWLQARHNAGELAGLAVKPFDRGSDLAILDGPFAGQHGECVETGVHRIKLLLDMLGGKVEISVPVRSVTLSVA